MLLQLHLHHPQISGNRVLSFLFLFITCFLFLYIFNLFVSLHLFVSSFLLLFDRYSRSTFSLHDFFYFLLPSILFPSHFFLSSCQCRPIGVRPPRWAQTQVDRYHGGELRGCRLPDAWPAPPPPVHAHTHLASGGSVSLLTLDTRLSWCNIKSSHLIWTVIMS